MLLFLYDTVISEVGIPDLCLTLLYSKRSKHDSFQAYFVKIILPNLTSLAFLLVWKVIAKIYIDPFEYIII